MEGPLNLPQGPGLTFWDCASYKILTFDLEMFALMLQVWDYLGPEESHEEAQEEMTLGLVGHPCHFLAWWLWIHNFCDF